MENHNVQIIFRGESTIIYVETWEGGIRENPIKMDDSGVPPFQETSMYLGLDI